MREIIHIQIGQGGNQLGIKYWEIIASEHGLTNDGFFRGDSDLQIRGIPVNFSESICNKFVPRAILIDLEPSVLEKIRNSSLGGIFRPDNFINGFCGASNNFARGFYTDGADLLDSAMEVIRKEVENCDSIQGFQILHAVGGGTGSGLGSLVLYKVLDEYTDRIRNTFSIFPSPKLSDAVVEPYNTLLTSNNLISMCHGTYIMDNEALYNICDKILKLEHPLYADYNHLISNSMSGVTTSIRFAGQLNADLRKLATNLVPFPRFHFFVTSHAPLCSRFNKSYKTYSIHEIVQDAFNCQNQMTVCDPRRGRFLTAAAIFRGKFSIRDIDGEVIQFQNKNSAYFAEWVPNNVKTILCDIPPAGFRKAITFVGNTTAIHNSFVKIQEDFSYMYKRRAYLHWFLEEGMEEEEFHEAEINILNIIEDYQRLQMGKAGINASIDSDLGIEEGESSL